MKIAHLKAPAINNTRAEIYYKTHVDAVEGLNEKIANATSIVDACIFRPIIKVHATTGSTVSVINGDGTILTAEENNGDWDFEIPHYGYWTVKLVTGSTITAKTVKVDTAKVYHVKPETVYRYGYRINKTEGDPYERVEYLYDAVGMTPAQMDFNTGVFDYGSWSDAWFITENKPLMLKYDGTVDYYLDPDDYTKKENGETDTDVANTAYEGNAMAQIPLCWISRYEDENYCYEIVSNVQYDETFKAYAHTRADGTIADYFYTALFGASGNAAKLRSISGQSLSQSLNATQQIAGATANGTDWYIGTWSQRELIRTLCVLIGKSTDTQSVFGNGNCRHTSSGQSLTESSLLATGTLKDKGQFYGYNSINQQVKVFHIEGFWGDQWLRTAGLINNKGTLYAKMTPEGLGYRVTDVTGYFKVGTMPTASESYINAMRCNEYGMTPSTVTGSGTTYYCDAAWSNNSQLNFLIVGGSANNFSANGGGFAFNVNNAPSNAYWNNGCTHSYHKKVF